MYTFILNPKAGGGRAGKVRPEIERYMAAAGLDFDVVETKTPAQATSAARAAALSSSVVVSTGGDGSLHHVASGVIEARLSGSDCVLGVLPVGTGNDFARMLGMPTGTEEALQALTTAERVAADHGWAIWEADGVAVRRPFINCAGIGMDAQAALLATKLKPYLRNASYVVAPALSVLRWRAPKARLSATSEAGRRAINWDGRLTMASVANGKWVGGGIHISPSAEIDDRALDLCLIPKLSIAKAYWLLPKAVKGKHEGRPEVISIQASRIKVETEAPVPIYVDGEPGAAAVTSASFEVAASELPMLRARVG